MFADIRGIFKRLLSAAPVFFIGAAMRELDMEYDTRSSRRGKQPLHAARLFVCPVLTPTALIFGGIRLRGVLVYVIALRLLKPFLALRFLLFLLFDLFSPLVTAV